MTVFAAADGTIVLEGACPSAEAEALVQLLTNTRGAAVDLQRCASAHAALVQVLMAFRPKLIGATRNDLMWRWVYPGIAGHK